MTIWFYNLIFPYWSAHFEQWRDFAHFTPTHTVLKYRISFDVCYEAVSYLTSRYLPSVRFHWPISTVYREAVLSLQGETSFCGHERIICYQIEDIFRNKHYKTLQCKHSFNLQLLMYYEQILFQLWNWMSCEDFSDFGRMAAQDCWWMLCVKKFQWIF